MKSFGHVFAFRSANSILRQGTKCILFVAPLWVAACGGSGLNTLPPPTLTIALLSSTVIAPQDGTQAQLGVMVGGIAAGAAFQVNVTELPAGVTAQFVADAGKPSGTVTFTGSPTAPAGTYTAKVHATSGAQATAQSFLLVVAAVAAVGSAVDSTLGVNGKLDQFMATSFQPADWDWKYFQQHPDTSALQTLGARHMRIQVLDGSVPWKANSQPQLASDWDFTELDATVQPVLGVTDHSPEFQIAVAPNLPGMLDSNGHFIMNPANLATYAQYCANLVRYYNKSGFVWGGKTFQSPAIAKPITWWGIHNEYNINGLTPSQYVQVYNAVVPAMLAVDSTIKFSALELSDFDFNVGDPRNNLPTFVSGVNAQVDVASTHFYSSCNQSDPDTRVFGSVPGFVTDVKYFYQALAARPSLANVPVWVTENNVNADFSSNGMSVCNPGQKFVSDMRGTSAFFSAWRPYVFSQLGKVGNRGLYHWDYPADGQYAEVDFGTGNKYLSYWVDYWLGRVFPSSEAGVAPDILQLNLTDSSTIEALATKNSDGSVVVLFADRAVHASADNNGTGDPRTVIVDLSALGNFTSATLLTMDAHTDVVAGPTALPVTPAAKMTLTLGGYGVSFLTLKP